MPGPAPKVDPVRRHARTGPLKLPAQGREGSPPSWPLTPKMSAAELRIWTDLWRTPHAVAWERLGWVRTVARYCRILVEAERRNGPAMARAEARQLEDKLGLTPKAMRMLLWEIVADEVGEKRQEGSDARSRFQAV